MEAREQIVLELKIENAEAVKQIADQKAKLADLAAEQERLNEQYKEGKISEDAYYNSLANITEQTITAKDSIKAYNNVLKDNTKQLNSNEGSLTQMRAQLKQMVSAYDNMSKAERESEQSGGALLKKIQEQTKAIQDAEEASGRHQRNVGNYPKVLDLTSTSIGKLLNGINGLTAAAPANANGLKAIAGGIKTVNLNLLKLLANPIVAIIAAIVLAIMGVIKVIKMVIDEMKSFDDAGTSIQSLLAAFQPILDIFRKALAGVAMALGEIVKGAAKVITAITSLIPAFRESAAEAQNYVQAMDALEEADRQFTLQKAKNDKEIADLQYKATQRDKYTAEQRKAFLKKAQDLERQNLTTEMKNERERVRLKEQEYLKAHGWENKKGEDRRKALEALSDAQKDELTKMRAHIIEMETSFTNATRSMEKKVQTFQEEVQREQEAAQQKRREAYKKHLEKVAQMHENELNAVRALEDARLAAMEDGRQKDETAARLAYNRAVEDLQRQLAEQKKAGTLSAKAEEAINLRLLEMEDAFNKQMAGIRKKAADEQEKKDKDEAKKRADRQARAKAAELKATELAENLKQMKELDEVGNNERAKLELQQQYADERVKKTQDEYDQLKAIGKDYEAYGYESLEAYNLALQEALNKNYLARQDYANKTKAIADYEAKVQTAKVNAVMGTLNSMQSLMEAIGEDNEAAAKASKVLALAQIAVETGVALAKGINSSQDMPYPGNLIAMATTIASVLSGIASAISTVKSAKFASGGYVQGAGTATSDSIPARLSNGESVMTAKATSMFYDTLSAMNVAGGGIPFPKSGHKRNFATGGVVSGEAISNSRQAQQMQDMVTTLVENIQPVVSVKEITNVSNRVKVKERIATT